VFCCVATENCFLAIDFVDRDGMVMVEGKVEFDGTLCEGVMCHCLY
jgi:hypothetical protein